MEATPWFFGVVLGSLVGSVVVPLTVAKRRYRGMGLRSAFTLSIYTACFLVFLLVICSHPRPSAPPLWQIPSSSSSFSAAATMWVCEGLAGVGLLMLHVGVYVYHLGAGFTWHMHPAFVHAVGLPGYCFFLAVCLFTPGFILVRLASLLLTRLAVLPPPFSVSSSPFLLGAFELAAGEMALVALFSVLFTWSILYHQA